MKIQDFQRKKIAQEKISMITCYDYAMAKIIEETDIDSVLVGDSAAMVTHGHDNTIMASKDMMLLHTAAVARGLKKTFLIADLPFLSYHKSIPQTMDFIERLMQAGAEAVKLEGATAHNRETIQHIVNAGIPVMGHIGLTGQSIHQLGGHKVQGKSAKQQEILMRQAKQLEDAGCFATVLECIPAELAADISNNLTIPTIGIGAGAETDGQILVFHDLLGLQNDINPKFVKRYLNGANLFKQAINDYVTEVNEKQYPVLGEHTYALDKTLS